MDGDVTSCFTRTTVIGEETVTVGLFRVDADGKPVKICPDAVCRSETDRICTHLVNGTRPAIWHDGIVYLIGAALSPETGNAERHYILRLRDGSTTFEKLFETTRTLNDLHLSGGILYAVSKPEFIGDTHLYYAIDPDLRYCTAIETGDEIFRFGRDCILMTDDTGTYLTDSVLRSAGRCCDATQRDVGILVEDGFWYLRDGTLRHVEAKPRGKATRILEAVRAFAVSGSRVFYQPIPTDAAEVLFYAAESPSKNGKAPPPDPVPYTGFRNAEIRCANLSADGRLTEDRAVFSPGEQEWLYLFDQYKHLGEAVAFATIKPGSTADAPARITDWITDGHQTYAIGERIT